MKKIDLSEIDKIVESLKKSKVLAMPTDSSYGFCTNALKEQMIRKILKIKNREDNPIAIFVSSIEMAKDYTEISDNQEKVLAQNLPGPFTFILKKKNNISDILTAGKDTVGIRIIDTELFKVLFDQIDFPLTATSANVAGGDSIYSADQIQKQFKVSKIDFLVDGGKLEKVEPSAVIDLTGDESKVLREGPISCNM